MIRNILRKALQFLHIDRFVKDLRDLVFFELRKIAFLMNRKIMGTDKLIVRKYFKADGNKRLHLGCGSNKLSGWLNSDYYLNDREVLHLDATGRYPFVDNSFDFIFSEHMIEHVNYIQGKAMLEECYRVLKPKGVLRLSTPNLKFLIDLYRNEKSDLQNRFIEHATKKYIVEVYGEELPCDTFVINNYMRAWGHQFIYDEKILKYVLSGFGFENIQRMKICESEILELKNLENINRKPEGLIDLESIIIEAVKP